MPDIVQLPDNEADIEEQQQHHRTDLIPQAGLPIHQIQEHHHHADDAAVHIGQSFLKVGLDGAAHVSCHLAHGIQ